MINMNTAFYYALIPFFTKDAKKGFSELKSWRNRLHYKIKSLIGKKVPTVWDRLKGKKRGKTK
jgi:hypothetical protein